MLNFLKTLLPDASAEEPPAPPLPTEEAQAPPPEEEEKENAYLRFLEAHERRAKRK
ncbi:MAG: hypothetical protein J6A63_00205 [Clostridia bacterium]|nr:hypothetical protein [Clostridia bacterium]